MTGFLLDTNVVSELRKGSRSDANVVEWFSLNKARDLWLSVVVVAELQRGVQLVERRDPRQSLLLQGWLDELVSAYDDRVLPISLDIALRWGSIGVPDPLPVLDGLIAATALEHDLTVVTRNVADIGRSGVRVVDPFRDSR
ncbi:MAG: type II toxin-antitoxin system VapC family toxin [Actinobacteria bacterium]|nr:type II toxin-antitoxin system VapC family toxin [Actinomycetota bacterium]